VLLDHHVSHLGRGGVAQGEYASCPIDLHFEGAGHDPLIGRRLGRIVVGAAGRTAGRHGAGHE
ncbi:MAG: hypothetical protein ACK559_36525, partial [bacterium]